MHMYKVRDYTTMASNTIGRNIPLGLAERHMRSCSLQHLPVLDAGASVGLLSLEQVDLLKQAGFDLRSFLVGDAMRETSVTLAAEDSLADATAKLLAAGASAAAVLEGARVIGVLLLSDVLSGLRRNDLPLGTTAPRIGM